MNTSIYRTTVLTLLSVCFCLNSGWGADQKADDKKTEKRRNAKALDMNDVLAPLFKAVLGDGPRGAANKVVAHVVRDANVAQNDAQVQQLAQQYLNQLRPVLMTELEFIRQVCDLPKEQRPKVKAAGEESLKEAAKDFAKLQLSRRQVVHIHGVDNSQPEPRTTIRKGLAKALQKSLTTEQMTRYTEEAAKRVADRKQAAILWLVARLDGTLYLTADQREKISAAISSQWQEKWENWLAMYQYGDQYFPTVPDQCIVAHLSDDQKSIWGGLQKIEISIWNFGGGQVQAPDDWWGDEPAEANANAAIGQVLEFNVD
jgi:hypothetical protein